MAEETTFEMEIDGVPPPVKEKGKEKEEEIISEDDSVISSSDYETKEGLRLMLSFDPVSARPVVQVQPQNIAQKKKRRKRSKEKKKAYDKVKSKNSQAANKKLYKDSQKKAKKQEKKSEGSTDGESKNARKKRLLRGNAHGVEVVNADEVMDKRFEEDSEELLVLDLQKKVQSVLKEEGTDVQVVPDSSLLEDLLAKKVKDNVHKDEDEEASPAFFLLDLGTVVRKYVQWLSCFPRIKPCYAVKCNPDGVIVKTITTCGGGFDCASVPEIKLALSQGAKPEDIIFANPSKPKKAIEYSKKVNVAKMTFDNVTELEKIHQLYPEAELVLRILGDDTYSLMAFGSKFGCTVPEESTHILERAKEINANVVGVSFHVGSWCTSSKAFIKTLELTKSVFETAKGLGFNFDLLDIGGGWPGFDTEDLSFREIAAPIRQAIDDMFEESIKIIAEPGRYFVTECAVLATSIIARRERVTQPNDPRIVERTDTPLHEQEKEKEEKKEEKIDDKPKKVISYYLADGVYGSFNNIFFDHAQPKANVLPKRNELGQDLLSSSPYESTLFGPTCDSVDVIAKNIHLPSLDHGDWLYFLNMGAYTSAAGSTFNGMARPPITYILTVPAALKEVDEEQKM